MNADLEKLVKLVDGGDCWEIIPFAYKGVALPIAHASDGDPLVGWRRFQRAVLGPFPLDLSAFDALKPEMCRGKCNLYMWADIRKLLSSAAETDPNLRTELEAFERALYAAIRTAVAAQGDHLTRNADELEKQAAEKLDEAKQLRERKRTFDEAFAATPETGVFTERPPKVARVDAEEKSSSYSEPQSESEDEEESS